MKLQAILKITLFTSQGQMTDQISMANSLVVEKIRASTSGLIRKTKAIE